MWQDAIRPSLVSVCRLLADSDSETVTASLHVLMCHAVLQLRAAGRHPPQSGVRLSPAGGRRQRDRHRVSVHVLMCHAVLQLRAAGRHPPQSGVRLSPACGQRQRDRHRVSVHVLMCHTVLQLRAAGRHPPQSGVRLSPAGGQRQRDRHRVSTCPDVSRRVTAACGRPPSTPVWCPSVACWRTVTARPSPRLYMS